MRILLACLYSFVGTVIVLSQGAPPLMSYQGRLTDDSGAPLTSGVYRLAFRLYTNAVPVPGEPLIWGRQYDASIVLGEFNVILGASGGVSVAEPAAVGELALAFAEPTRFLELKVVSGPSGAEVNRTILPRQQLLSTPYSIGALRAAEADVALVAKTTREIPDGLVTFSKLGSRGTAQNAELGDVAVSPLLGPTTLSLPVNEIPVPGMSASLRTRGRPVLVFLTGGENGDTVFGISGNAAGAHWMLRRDGVVIARYLQQVSLSGDSSIYYIPPSSISALDLPSAGDVHTYTLSVDRYGTEERKVDAVVNNVRLVAFEL